jgi:putative membrane protein
VRSAFWTWIGNAVALYLAVAVSGSAQLSGWTALALASAVFGVVNFIVKPIVLLLSLPLIVLTLGIALFFVNALMLAITDAIVDGISFGSDASLLGATVIVWLVNLAIALIPGPWQDDSKRRARKKRER